MEEATKIYDKWLTENGLIHHYDEHDNIVFKYQGLNLILVNPGEDKNYLQLVLPYIYDFSTEEERSKVLIAANITTMQRKVVKAIVLNDNVNLNVEMFIDTTPDVEDFMERVLDILVQGRLFFYEQMHQLNS